jgi:hypothetical protein
LLSAVTRLHGRWRGIDSAAAQQAPALSRRSRRRLSVRSLFVSLAFLHEWLAQQEHLFRVARSVICSSLDIRSRIVPGGFSVSFLRIPSLTLFSLLPVASALLKRQRAEAPSPIQKDLARIVEEQASLIESFKKEKTGMESSLTLLKVDHERVIKENQLLRKAVHIQQERQVQAEQELKAAHAYRGTAEETMKKLEQVIVSLRYHLQATEQASLGNDFSRHHRPPDVY